MTKMILFYIEKEKSQREHVSGELEKHNVNVLSFPDWQTAFNEFVSSKADIVLFGLNKSITNELKEIKKHSPNTIIILLIPDETSDLSTQSAINSADHFLVKPVNTGQLVATIKQFSDRKILEQKLEKSLQTIALLTGGSSDILFTLDQSLKIKNISNSIKSVLGYTPDELTGRSFSDIIHPDDTVFFQQIRKVPQLNVRLVTKDEKIKDFLVKLKYILDNEKISEIIGVATENEEQHHNDELIHDLKKSNKKLQLANQELSKGKDELLTIFDLSGSALLLVRPDDKITAANQKAVELFQIDKNKVLQTPFSNLIDNVANIFQDKDQFINIIQELKQQPDEFSEKDIDFDKLYTRVLKTKKSIEKFVSVFCMPIKKDNNTAGFLWSFFDVTRIKEANEQLRAIVKVSPIPYVINREIDGKIFFVNKPMSTLLNNNPENLIGQDIQNFYAKSHDYHSIKEQLTQHEQVLNYELEIESLTGEKHWVLNSIVKTEIDGNTVWINAFYDISIRRKAEQALKKERNFIDAILETSGALIMVLDSHSNIIRFNRACQNLTGKKPSEVIGKKPWDLFCVAEQCDELKTLFQGLSPNQTPYISESALIDNEGLPRLITWSNTALYDADGNVEFIVATGIDITVRKKLEESLRLYREIFLNSNDSIVVLNKDGYIIERNPTHKKYSGMSDKDIAEYPVYKLINSDGIDNFFKNKPKQTRIRHEFELKTENNKTLYIDLSLFPLKNENDEIEKFVGIGRDNTSRKEAEEKLKRAHDELEIRVKERTQDLADLNEALKEEIIERMQTENALRKSETQKKAILNAIPDVMFRINKKGEIIDYHVPKDNNFSISAEMVINKSIFAILRNIFQKKRLKLSEEH